GWLLRLDADGKIATSCPATVAADVPNIAASTATIATALPAAASSVVTFGATTSTSLGGASATYATELICGR
ncbi:MAG: hypothetical protein H6Q89_4833, partial [Myxococcaceae bacterium]|nr:hypothetical protein [Myxococcaceae bacterium]